jgi:cell division protein FtsZ
MNSDLSLNPNSTSPVITFAEDRPLPGKIMVVGVGNAGVNAISRMSQSGTSGVELVAANTDVRALRLSQAPTKLQIGARVTHGYGCGGVPERGRQAALEDTESLNELLEGEDMVFVTGGLGSGTCTGAAPVIASIASSAGALTVAVVSLPFGFQGRKRRQYADTALRELQQVADTVIAIANENLLTAVGQESSLEEALRHADNVLCHAVQAISETITKPGIINLDIADLRTVMAGSGMGMIGTGVAAGVNRSVKAAESALSSPLLEVADLRGAHAALINIAAGRNSLTLHETRSAVTVVEEAVRTENLVVGAVYDDALGDTMRLAVVVTGIGSNREAHYIPSGTEATASWEPLLGRATPRARNGGNLSNLDVPTFRRQAG